MPGISAAGPLRQPRHDGSRTNAIRWLRRHSASRYGPLPTAWLPNAAPYCSTASRGTTAVKHIARYQTN
ncbi:MAG: hypothetical protein BWX70_02037 [Verrucomicrobia bacterium ADurb.Bin070]|nr:MAG: hypothetical protein BWX70_02037 [Verrucomicrobia bacterium ADurb.Bin070]